jgi:hypothetical protein
MSSTVGITQLQAEGIDETIQLDAAGGLDQDGVALAEAWAKRVEGGLAIGDVLDVLGGQPGLDGAVDDASGIRPDDDEALDERGGRSADGQVAGLVAIAQLEHLAEDREVPAGHPGQEVQRGHDGAG